MNINDIVRNVNCGAIGIVVGYEDYSGVGSVKETTVKPEHKQYRIKVERGFCPDTVRFEYWYLKDVTEVL